MTFRTCQPVTGKPLGVQRGPLEIETTGQESYVIVCPKTRITDQIRMLGDP